MKLEHEGRLTAGYYNDMEAGHPVFLDGCSLSDWVKELLEAKGLDPYFCYGTHEAENEEDVDNPLIGRKARLILEIEGEESNNEHGC